MAENKNETRTETQPNKSDSDSSFIELSKSKTDEKYGKNPYERDIETHIKNGLIILDKPKGPTSHQAAAWVRDIFNLKKAGHSGTLDPGVTGVLPILLDNATKIIPALVKGKKEYICLMQLHNTVPEKYIRKTREEFTGKISQMPPVQSAVKRQLRTREIYELEILEIDGPYVLFRARVEAGTYIRTLCVDWGKKLRTKAHMQELRRTIASGKKEDESHTLQDIKDAWEFYQENKDETSLRKIIRPLEEGVTHIPKIIVKDTSVSALCHGAPLHTGGITKISKDIKKGDLTAIMSQKGELVALAECTASVDEIPSSKGTIAKISRVVMPEDTYPRTW